MRQVFTRMASDRIGDGRRFVVEGTAAHDLAVFAVAHVSGTGTNRSSTPGVSTPYSLEFVLASERCFSAVSKAARCRSTDDLGGREH